MRKIYISIIALSIFISCKNTEDKDSVVARVNDETIYHKELNMSIQQELFDALNRIYGMKSEALRQLVNLKIFSIEAGKVELTKDEYLKKYVDDKICRVGLDSLFRYYNISSNNNNFHGKQLYHVSDSTFEGNLLKQDILKSCIVSELIDSLRNIYHVETYLYPPKSPKIKLHDMLGYYRGDTLSKVSVTVISDFDCEKCIEAHDLYNSVYEEYKDKVRFGYVNFSAAPTLSQLACDAANEQNKFWQFHDSLYSQSSIIDSSAVYTIAKQVGLDLEKFDTDLKQDKRREKIENTIHQLVLMGVYATPTVIVNGRLIMDSNSKNEITHLIEQELKK